MPRTVPMKLPASPSRARGRRRLGLALGIPVGLGVGVCFLLQRDARALLAPWLGPWAGTLYGHSACTMAHVAPELTIAAGVLAAAGLVALGWAWREGGPWIALVLVAAGSLMWTATAVLSLFNTL